MYSISGQCELFFSFGTFMFKQTAMSLSVVSTQNSVEAVSDRHIVELILNECQGVSDLQQLTLFG